MGTAAASDEEDDVVVQHPTVEATGGIGLKVCLQFEVTFDWAPGTSSAWFETVKENK